MISQKNSNRRDSELKRQIQSTAIVYSSSLDDDIFLKRISVIIYSNLDLGGLVFFSFRVSEKVRGHDNVEFL